MLPKDGNIQVKIQMSPIKGTTAGKVHVTHKPIKMRSITRILAIFLRSKTLKGEIETVDIKYSK